jgi:hypothetical protein
MTMREKMKDHVIRSLLGTPHIGWRQFFYMLDPYKAEQFVRAPKLFDDINICFSFIYFIGIVLFACYAFIAYFSQSPIEINAMVFADTLPPIKINITTSCSTTFGCGNYTKSSIDSNQWIQQTNITINQVWDNVIKSSPCFNQSKSYPIQIDESILLTVCYSSGNKDGIFLTVPFTSTYSTSASLLVTITGDSQYYTNNMYSLVDLEATQSKTVYFSQTAYFPLHGDITYEPYTADFFYNGHQVTSTIGTLTFVLQQFAYSNTKSIGTTILTTLGSIGGFSSIYLAITAMFRGVLVMSYKSIFVLKKESSAGLGLNAVQLCCLSLCRLAGLAPPAS